MIHKKQIRKPLEKYYDRLCIEMNIGNHNSHIYKLSHNDIFNLSPKNNAMRILKTFYKFHTWYLIDMHSCLNYYPESYK